MNKNFKAGQSIWVVELDECDEPICVVGNMFLAEIAGYAIVTSFYFGVKDLEGTLERLREESLDDMCDTLKVVKMEQCYKTKAEAEIAMKMED